MPNAIWNEPILVGDDLIFSARQAEKYLTSMQMTGERIDVARAAILGALDGRVSADRARETFVAAVTAYRN
ncbi:DUF982 domain-containing protein [Neorhizobium sp. DT-125]|uniref:DUF982 domain-containing protein n=1 Tax=Neorhizobium sp. DT-125 TaxID=3396163 RepID=UPI003F193D55